jgi:serine/threonine-protein kinase
MWTALEGVMVGSRYEMRAHLATGGMAAVFRAWDHRLQRPVAIKVLRQLDDANEHAIERFRREARATAALCNPHIVEVYDFFEEDGCYYLVMELVEGINLKEHLASYGPLPPETALTIAAQVCDALAAAHDAGFIHRDIKPQNILLSANGPAKLADFGIVHIPRAEGFTTGGIVLGTADYVSPEQAQGLALAPATDIYSLGVVLYEMLTGVLPFTGTTPIAVAMRHATAPVPPLRYVNPTVPRIVERIVLRALRKEPDERFSDARAVAAAMRRACATLMSLAETDVSGHRSATVASAVSPMSGASEWWTLARRLSQPLAAVSDDGRIPQSDFSHAPHGPGWTVDDEEEDTFSEFAEHYAPSAAPHALPRVVARIMTAAGASVFLLVGIVILHLLR